MGHFADLTPYAYLRSPWTEQPDALNVGWLQYGETFPQGDTPEGFLARLQALVARPVNRCRGSHTCWCAHGHGNGEIRVTGRDGVVYAAPVLIAHYVATHAYRPPQPFVDAVMELPLSADAVDPHEDSNTGNPTPRD